MGVSPKILKESGCTPEAWRELFAPKDPATKLPQIKRLETLIQNRVNDGQMRCIAGYRTWAAVDMAYDVPFAQTTPTIIQGLLGRKWETTEDMLAELQRWGLKVDDLFIDGTLGGKPCKVVNPPTFYKVFVPLVKAYVTIRWAKLYNDRNKSPLFKYEPIQPNEENRILCEIMTYLIQVMSADFNYSSMIKDVIFQTLMYATCLSFPREVWTRETQTEEVDGKPKEVIQKEGLRYELPHPSLVFYDLDYPIYTFNTDTGCEFAGYWKIVRYGDILDNPNFWNRRKIGYSGKNDWQSIFLTNQYFQEVFPCRMAFPVVGVDGQSTSRQQQASYYNTNQRDQTVLQTDIFMKLVPSRWKLGTYRHPIWVRFIVASDSTVLYAEPCAYCPVRYSGYDSNSLRSKNSSLALEVLPFQDILGNTLSQILLTAKQNLLRVFFYDKNQIDSTQIDEFKNRGETKFRDMIFVPFDPMKLSRSGGSEWQKAVNEIDFGQKSVQELFQSINTQLGILERLLQLSAQESGAAASHQQSKAEVELIGSSTSNRVQFTGSGIDDFMDATKVQLHDAALAYMDDTVEAMVPSDIPNVVQHLNTLGFQVISKVINGEGRLLVRGSKKDIKITALATSSHTPERQNDSRTAQIMLQTVSAIAANQPLMEAIGVKPILEMYTKASILAGVDKDFVLRPDQKAEVAALQKMAEQIQIACAKHVEETVAKPVAEEIQKLELQVQDLDKAMQNVIKTISQPAAQPAVLPAPPDAQAPLQPPTGPIPGPV